MSASFFLIHLIFPFFAPSEFFTASPSPPLLRTLSPIISPLSPHYLPIISILSPHGLPMVSPCYHAPNSGLLSRHSLAVNVLAPFLLTCLLLLLLLLFYSFQGTPSRSTCWRPFCSHLSSCRYCNRRALVGCSSRAQSRWELPMVSSISSARCDTRRTAPTPSPSYATR